MSDEVEIVEVHAEDGGIRMGGHRRVCGAHMNDYLARRRARHEAATPGPWYADLIGPPRLEASKGVVAEVSSRKDTVWAEAARNDEAATLDVLDAAAAWRRAVLIAGVRRIKGQDTATAMVAVYAAEDAIIHALDALEGEREPDGDE